MKKGSIDERLQQREARQLTRLALLDDAGPNSWSSVRYLRYRIHAMKLSCITGDGVILRNVGGVRVKSDVPPVHP